ncbi:hypothetical protein JYU34_021105 [Plutella xylostella]|uniref:Uncharacterized protein n=1 Tax=Plutella xylostella TaxID=51655 RepID=A0ABQ7PSR0_PLUXY|nr:hypothetical protein JYU34_021105 [Plutella xylostella]
MRPRRARHESERPEIVRVPPIGWAGGPWRRALSGCRDAAARVAALPVTRTPEGDRGRVAAPARDAPRCRCASATSATTELSHSPSAAGIATRPGRRAARAAARRPARRRASRGA